MSDPSQDLERHDVMQENPAARRSCEVLGRVDEFAIEFRLGIPLRNQA
jgi:hypothetical protein